MRAATLVEFAAMNHGKFLQFSTVLVAATTLVVSRRHHDHIDPEQPQQPGSLWATSISGTSVGSVSAVGTSTSAGSFDLRAG